MSATAETRVDAVRRRLLEDTPFYAEKALKIVNKDGELVPFRFKAAQLALMAKIKEQEALGLPVRGRILKARRVGMSTAITARMMQGATQREFHKSLVVAQKKKTAGELFEIGRLMYAKLPPELKPPLRNARRSQELIFGERAREAWEDGSDLGLLSSYEVDTAEEVEGGRGLAYRDVHATEVAFWPDIGRKLTALKNTVPRRPGTMFLEESTANGHNEFKDLWDDAERGVGSYFDFFWPWWKDEEYTFAFVNERERERFEKGLNEGRYGDEIELMDRFELTLEQLHWRRVTIDDECNGKLDTFSQEYPSTPEESFLASGRRVFDPYLVRSLLVKVDVTDPRIQTDLTPGPTAGAFAAGRVEERAGRNGKIEVPRDPLWTPSSDLDVRTAAPWRVWGDAFELGEGGRPKGSFVVVGDPSGNVTVGGGGEADFNVISVIDHETREQVAEYRARIDPDLLAVELMLAAQYFNDAWMAVEVTGYGGAIARTIWHDYFYRAFFYVRKSLDKKTDRQEKKLGWSTDVKTKGQIEQLAMKMLREGSTGVRSRHVVEEMLAYVIDDRGRTGAERGKHDDCLMAWMIAQFLAGLLPLRAVSRPMAAQRTDPYGKRNPVTGY